MAQKPQMCGWCGQKHAGECEEAKEAAELVLGYAVVKAAVLEAAAGRSGVAGSLPCPVCEVGTVRYCVAEINGHVHAACSTKGCVRFLE